MLPNLKMTCQHQKPLVGSL